MRKFTQAASVVLGALLLLFVIPAGGKETEARGLDSQFAWRISQGPDRFVAVAKMGRGGYAATSRDGMEWQMEKMMVGFNAVTHAGGKFVAVGEHGAVGVTTDGVNWRIRSMTTNELCGVGFTEGCFVAAGCAPVQEVFTSRDGSVWRRHVVEAEGALAKFLETWVTVTNRAAEAMSGSVGEELRALCRAKNFELRGK